MLNQPLFDKLLQLRLPAFRDGLRQQQDNPQYASLSFEERLALLVEQECLHRHDRRIQRLLKTADFPTQAAVADIDFSPARGLERRIVLELALCHWIHNHHHLFVLGPTGSGKTYLACAFGNAALRCGYTVRYIRTSRLLQRLAQVHQDGSYHTLLRSLAKLDVLILDDWMRDPLTVQNAQDLLEIVDDRFGHSSVILVSQVPITDWHLRIPDPTLADAILDRLVHNAHRLTLEGESQRKLRAMQG
jgi:DNA replication protein DnaC